MEIVQGMRVHIYACATWKARSFHFGAEVANAQALMSNWTPQGTRRTTCWKRTGFSRLSFSTQPCTCPRCPFISSGMCYRMCHSQWPRSFSFLFPPPEGARYGTRCSQWAFRSCYRCRTTPTAGFFTQWAVYRFRIKKGKQMGLCSAWLVLWTNSSVFPLVTRCRLLAQSVDFLFVVPAEARGG